MINTFRYTTAILALSLGACSDTQVANFTHRLDNFTAAVHSVDNAVAAVSATLYKNCTSIQTVAMAANDIAGQCSKASTVVGAANAVIDSYCQRQQVTDIASAVAATAASINAAKTQLSAAKSACAKGG